MSKPIYLTKEYVSAIVEEFRQNITEAKMSDGKITFTKRFDYTGADDTKAQVVFTLVAYIKMLSLLKHFDSEVAWHGTVKREGEDRFIITDIAVYPQEVTGATVNTNQEEYQKWMMALDDDYFNSMRMQGHSHVNMGTTPSSVDTTHQQQILAQLKDNDYYIFMIFNKRLEHTIKIYDYANNVMYEDEDVVVSVAADGFDNDSFLAEADKAVKRKTYSASSAYEGLSEPYLGKRSRLPRPYDSQVVETGGGKSEKLSSGGNAEEDKTKPASKKRSGSGKRGSERRCGNSQTSMSSGLGYYGGAGAIVDWDQAIFGDRCLYD